MKLGKYLLPTAALMMLASCAGPNASVVESPSEQPSESEVVSCDPIAPRAWTNEEKEYMNLYWGLTLPEFELPEAATVSWETYDGASFKEIAITVDFKANANAQADIVETLTEEYGEYFDATEQGYTIYEWEAYPDDEEETQVIYCDLDYEEGKLTVSAYADSMEGYKQALARVFEHHSGLGKMSEKAPDFPWIKGEHPTFFMDLDPLDVGDNDYVFFQVQDMDFTALEEWKAEFDEAGWKMYQWVNSGGSANSTFYTCVGNDLAFYFNDAYISDYGIVVVYVVFNAYTAGKNGNTNYYFEDTPVPQGFPSEEIEGLFTSFGNTAVEAADVLEPSAETVTYISVQEDYTNTLSFSFNAGATGSADYVAQYSDETKYSVTDYTATVQAQYDEAYPGGEAAGYVTGYYKVATSKATIWVEQYAEGAVVVSVTVEVNAWSEDHINAFAASLDENVTSLPVFTTVDGVVSASNSSFIAKNSCWQMVYTAVTAAECAAYVTALTEAGFTATDMTEAAGTNYTSYTRCTNGEVTVDVFLMANGLFVIVIK